MINGWRNSHLRRDAKSYDDNNWWDRNFYTEGISHRQTISPRKHRLSAGYHYTSVEQRILRHLFNSRIQQKPALLGEKATDTDLLSDYKILDIGSGSGHWIDFYRSFGAQDIAGVDVSKSSVNYLQEKYKDENDIALFHGKALNFLTSTEETFDIINAIGVMFHIVDDAEWSATIHAMASRLRPSGLLIIGEYFGWFDGLNVQVDENGYINKRLRSIWNWRRTLRKEGLRNFSLYRNRAYLHINDPLPEASILAAEF